MRLIRPQTSEYRECLLSLLRMRFVEPLQAIRQHPDKPLQIVNEGDDTMQDGHPLTFVKYNTGGSFTLFPL